MEYAKTNDRIYRHATFETAASSGTWIECFFEVTAQKEYSQIRCKRDPSRLPTLPVSPELHLPLGGFIHYTAMICHGDHSFCLNNIDGEKRTRRRKNGGYRIKFSFSNSSAADSQGETPPESSVQGNDAEDAVAELLSPGPNPAEDFDESQDLDHKDDELAQEPELSTSDTEEEQDISHSFQLELDSQQEQDNEKKSWNGSESSKRYTLRYVYCPNASIRCRNCSFASFFCLSCALMVHARINKTHYLERHDGKSWVDLGDASTELIASELKGDSLDHTNHSGQFPSPSQGVMLLQDFLPDCAMPREMCKTIIYDPDIDLSHVSELHYLSCKCCRVETLLCLGLWAMSPSNPTSAVSLFSMKKLFKQRFQGSTAINVYSFFQFCAMPWRHTFEKHCVLALREYCHLKSKLRSLSFWPEASPSPAEAANAAAEMLNIMSQRVTGSFATENGCGPVRDFKAGKKIQGHNKKGRDFLGVFGAVFRHEIFLSDNSFSHFPELQDTFFGIGNFHVWAHAVWCRLHFALRRHHPSGYCDGEAIERTWAPLEKMRTSVISMTQGNFWHNLGQRLCEVNVKKK
eukprot:g759.t1